MSEVEKADLGVVGLAVVGADLARNAARKGFGVALFNRRGEPPGALMRSHGSEGRFVPSKSLPDFVAPLKTPRIAIVTVAAGKSVDEMVDEIMPHLEPRDILVDAGNSLFTDSQRRVKTCEAKSVRFVGTGVSGGEEGALNGPGMMPGGDRAAYDGSGVQAAMLRLHRPRWRGPLRQGVAQRHRIRRHSAHRRDLRHSEIRLRF